MITWTETTTSPVSIPISIPMMKLGGFNLFRKKEPEKIAELRIEYGGSKIIIGKSGELQICKIIINYDKNSVPMHVIITSKFFKKYQIDGNEQTDIDSLKQLAQKNGTIG